jgi:hypothetical protein
VIIAVSSVKNEAAIIETTVRHYLADCEVIISDGGSTDGTRDILESLPITVWDQEGPFDQAAEILNLTRAAKARGADWVVPFDADEFWCDLDRLNVFDESVGIVEATVFGHRDWEWRHEGAKPLPKVAFRDATAIAWGNHAVEGHGWTHGGFQIRELQYQSFEHFLAKIDKARELYESSDFPLEYGSHMRRLVAMSDQERAVEWARLDSIPTVYDPIPVRGAAR